MPGAAGWWQHGDLKHHKLIGADASDTSSTSGMHSEWQPESGWFWQNQPKAVYVRGLACQACGLLNAILPLQHWFLRFYVQLVVVEVKLKPKGTVRAFTIKQL